MSNSWVLAKRYAYISFIRKLRNQEERFKALKELRMCLDECQEIEDKDKTRDELWAEGYLSGIELCLKEIVGEDA